MVAPEKPKALEGRGCGGDGGCGWVGITVADPLDPEYTLILFQPLATAFLILKCDINIPLFINRSSTTYQPEPLRKCQKPAWLFILGNGRVGIKASIKL